eukprot:5603056-Pyramimonas_sp.AAC.1
MLFAKSFTHHHSEGMCTSLSGSSVSSRWAPSHLSVLGWARRVCGGVPGGPAGAQLTRAREHHGGGGGPGDGAPHRAARQADFLRAAGGGGAGH